MQDFVGQHIDRYRITERLGMGGMAVVYKAYDTRLERDVALKLIRTESIPQDQHERLLKRFEQEARTQARFNHPHIVPAFDYGEYQGTPFLVLACVTGSTLKDRFEGAMPVAKALEILIPIADAVAYAHSMGVLHRDIKPSNILFSQEGTPMLTDFGIAKVLETTEATLTGTGLGVGTPEYMAPEQWQGKATQASDQYALGVVLFELLTGQKPFTAETPLAVAMKQLNEPLPRPSTLNPGISQELEKVLYKVLARKPIDRFENVKILNQRLRALHLSVPIVDAQQFMRRKANPPILEDKMGWEDKQETFDELASKPIIDIEKKFVRNREKKRGNLLRWIMWMGVGLISIVLLSVVLRNVLDRSSNLSTENLNNIALSEMTPAENYNNEEVFPEIVADDHAQETIETFGEVEETGSYEQNGISISSTLPVFSTEKITTDNVDLVKELGIFGKGTISSIALSPDGKKLSVAGGIGIYLYDYESLEQIMVINTGYSVDTITFSPQGDVLASGADMGVIALWDTETGRLLRTLENQSDWDTQLVFSPDGSLLASAGETNTESLTDTNDNEVVILWDVISGDVIHMLDGHRYQLKSISFSPDGLFLAAGDDDSTIYVWNTQTGNLGSTIEAKCGAIHSLVFSQDGNSIAAGCNTGAISLWDVSSGNHIQKYIGDTSPVAKLALSPDGSLLAAGTNAGNIAIWEFESGNEQLTFSAHSNSVNGLTFTSDSTTLISGSADGSVRTWDVNSGRQLNSLGGFIPLSNISFLLDNNLAALASNDGLIFFLNLTTGRQIGVIEGQTDLLSCVAFSLDGTLLAAGSRDGIIQLWEAGTGKQVSVLDGHIGEVSSVTFSPDGTLLASGGLDNALRVWDVGSLNLINTFGSEGSAIFSIEFSSDGAMIASGDNIGSVNLWDLKSGDQLQTVNGPLSLIGDLAFTKSGDKLAVAGSYFPSFGMEAINEIDLFDTESGELLIKFLGEGYVSVSSVTFTPDGNILASGCSDGIVRLWDVQTGDLIMKLEGHLKGVSNVEFSSDGTVLASGSIDGTIRLWGIP